MQKLNFTYKNYRKIRCSLHHMLFACKVCHDRLTVTEQHTIANVHCVCLTVLTSILWIRPTGYVESCRNVQDVDELKQRLIEIETWSRIQQNVIDEDTDQLRDRIIVSAKSKANTLNICYDALLRIIVNLSSTCCCRADF